MNAWTDKSIFDALADLDEPARQAWWDHPAHQGISEPMRASVQRLLVSHDLLARQASAFLAEPAAVDALGGAVMRPDPWETEQIPVGTQWGPWRIGRELGRGGMGVVFEAERAQDYAQQVALKVIRPGLTDREVFRRFVRERNALARLEHPHIARLIDGGLSPQGRPYLVMERVDGADLETAARTRSLSEILALFLQLTDAVAHAHRNLLVHRDIKPSNVWVTPQGAVKLLDFGVAKLLEDGQERPEDPNASSGATVFGWRVLTPQHAAPEQLQGLPVSTATDVYAIGALMYRVVTGAPPTGEDAVTAEAAAQAVLETIPVPPSRHPALARGYRGALWARNVTPGLDAVVLRCLEKRPDRRYPSVDALRDDLQALQAGLPLVHIDLGTVARLRAAWTRRRPEWVMAGLGLSGVTVGLGAAALRGEVGMAAAMVALATTSLAAAWYSLRAARLRDQATERLTQLRHLLRTVLLDYHDLVEPLPGSAPVRHRMVNDAVVFLERLGADAQAPRAVRRDVGTGWRKVGFVQRNGFRRPHMGDTVGAMRSYDAGLAVLARLRQEDPQDGVTAYEWAMTLSAKAGVLGEDGQVEPALRALDQAADVFAQHAERERFPHLHRLEWARTHLRQCDVLWMATRHADALEALDRAVKVLNTLEARAPGHPELPHVRVWAHGAGARVHRAQGQWAEVHIAVLASEQILRRLVEQQPNNARFQEDLAGVMLWRMSMAARLGDVPMTERAGRETVQRLTALAAADPLSVPTRGLWADALVGLGRDLALASGGRLGLVELEVAGQRVQALLEAYPEDADLQARWVMVAVYRAWAEAWNQTSTSAATLEPAAAGAWAAAQERLNACEARWGASADRYLTLQALLCLLKAWPDGAAARSAARAHIRTLLAAGQWARQGWSRFGEDEALVVELEAGVQ